jgi:hypothetical protein
MQAVYNCVFRYKILLIYLKGFYASSRNVQKDLKVLKLKCTTAREVYFAVLVIA